jgi:hypothetical protein
MKQLARTPLTLAVGIMLAPQGSGQPEKGIAQNGGKAIAQKRQPRARPQQSAEQQAINSLESEVSEIRKQLAEQHQLTQELETAKTEQDVAIQKELVKYTRWLVIVGFIQFIALIVQAFVFWLTLKKIET